MVQKFDKMYEFSSPLYGLFNLYNLTAAIGAVDMLGVASLEEICRVVENFAGVEGRMEVVSTNPLIIVDFAHTPDGMQKVLDALKDKDIVVVFGAGGDRDRSKRPKMGLIASRYAKKVIVTSDNPRNENPYDILNTIEKALINHKNMAENEGKNMKKYITKSTNLIQKSLSNIIDNYPLYKKLLKQKRKK